MGDGNGFGYEEKVGLGGSEGGGASTETASCTERGASDAPSRYVLQTICIASSSRS